jgi:lysophospholipase L1-like esterase
MRRLLLLIGSVALVYLLGEAALRLIWDDYYVRGARGNFEYHATRGWANKRSSTVDFGKPEYRFIAHHNSLGLRGAELPARKPAGRMRVLVLGDSMTYGLGVEDDETFSARLEHLDPRLEVLNAGVPGYSTAEELLLLQELGPRLQPDLVLLMFLPNDIPDGLRNTFSRVRVEDGLPRFEPPADPSIEHPALRAKQVRHPVLSHSYLYRFISDRLKILRYMMDELLSLPIDDHTRLSPSELEQAWTQERALVRGVARETAAQGAKLLLVVIPEPAQVEPEVKVVGLDPSDFLCQERLREIAQAEGIELLDLLPGLIEAHRSSGRPLHYRYDRHWNAAGHLATAELIARELPRVLDGAAKPAAHDPG